MKRKLVLVALALALSGCGQDGSATFDPSAPAKPVPSENVTVAQYRGQDLFCLEQPLAHSNTYSYTCNFAAFYNEPPHHGSKLPVAHVWLVTMTYQGHTLYCLASAAGHKVDAKNCDFDRYYAEYGQGPLPAPS